MGRTYNFWMLNCWCTTWPVGFKRFNIQFVRTVEKLNCAYKINFEWKIKSKNISRAISIDEIIQVHCLSKREFSIQCALVLPLSVSSILAFPWGHPVACLRHLSRLSATYILLNISFHSVFQKAVSTQYVTKPVSFPYFYCTYDISLSPLILCNNSSFLTRLVQLMFEMQ